MVDDSVLPFKDADHKPFPAVTIGQLFAHELQKQLAFHVIVRPCHEGHNRELLHFVLVGFLLLNGVAVGSPALVCLKCRGV